ncbi:MAG: DUF1499 domain-containing protein [Candidatus Thiodiazotropha sp.]
MLSKCPDKPNCVSSEYQNDSHYIAPILFPPDRASDIQV